MSILDENSLRENDQLRCMILTHVDDFIITGTERYVTEVIRKISEVLTVSKVEYDSFRFTGVDVSLRWYRSIYG